MTKNEMIGRCEGKMVRGQKDKRIGGYEKRG